MHDIIKLLPIYEGFNPKRITVTIYNSNSYILLWSDEEHYNYVIMGTMASQITSLTIVYSIVYSDADQRKHQSSASLAFVREIHRDRWIPRTNDQ